VKAMVLRNPGPAESSPLRSEEVPRPVPGTGEVLLRVLACGACHTDLHTVEGDLSLPKLPIIPGHQVVGRIEDTGEGMDRFARGDRVGVTWFGTSCGSCEFCETGRENLCSRARFTGLHTDGGYAEFMVVAATSAFAIPELFSDIEATPLLCGGVIGYRALQLSEVRSGQRLGLYGFGNSAHIVLQIAVKRGCEVHVFTRSTNHRELALDLGAEWVGSAEDVPPRPMHSSIIFAPAGSLVPFALNNLDKGGTIALAGITMTDIPAMPYRLIYGERTLRSVANTTRRDAEELLREAAAIPIRTVVEPFPLDRANEVLVAMQQSRLKAGAALIPS
jgi:alcohol dehydrogenase, propanol-preferring